jgi:hypothetical protein
MQQSLEKKVDCKSIESAGEYTIVVFNKTRARELEVIE